MILNKALLNMALIEFMVGLPFFIVFVILVLITKRHQTNRPYSSTDRMRVS